MLFTIFSEFTVCRCVGWPAPLLLTYKESFFSWRDWYAFFQFQKNGRDFEKLGKALQPDELTATLGLMTLEQKHLYLEKAFEEHLDMYSPVIERLAID